MNGAKYLKSLEYDREDPQAVIDVIKQILTVETFCPEQTLFCIGCVLDKNKEEYIKALKKERSSLLQKTSEYSSKIASLQRRLNDALMRLNAKKPPRPVPKQPPKKTVVIVKKRTNG